MMREYTGVVIEDDDDLRIAMLVGFAEAHALAAQGWDTLAGGLESLRRLRAALGRDPNFAVIDPGLSDATGAEAVAAVRREFPETAICVVTGSSELEEACRVAGATSFLNKGRLGRSEIVRATIEAIVNHEVSLRHARAARLSAEAKDAVRAAKESVAP